MKSCVTVPQGSPFSFYLSALALALCLPACGSSDDGVGVGAGGTGSAGSGSNPPATEDVGTMLTTPVTCTEPRTICMSMVVPATMEGQPTLLLFDIFDTAEQPNHLPNGYAGSFAEPSLTPGTQMHFELTDGGLQGDYWMWVIMYMEGGGYGAPVRGVDYIMHSEPAPLRLDGTPINVTEPVELGL